MTGALIDSLTGGNTFAFLCEAPSLYVCTLSIFLVHTHTDPENMIVSDLPIVSGPLVSIERKHYTVERRRHSMEKKKKNLQLSFSLIAVIAFDRTVTT